eukprot:COSAG02_NODE_78_length_40609_cov_19.893730_8_plen_223_part_00
MVFSLRRRCSTFALRGVLGPTSSLSDTDGSDEVAPRPFNRKSLVLVFNLCQRCSTSTSHVVSGQTSSLNDTGGSDDGVTTVVLSCELPRVEPCPRCGLWGRGVCKSVGLLQKLITKMVRAAPPLLPEPRQNARPRAANTLRPARPPTSSREESPAGCACLQLLQQPMRPSLIDGRKTTQIRSPPVSTQFPFLYSNLRLEYPSSMPVQSRKGIHHCSVQGGQG